MKAELGRFGAYACRVSGCHAGTGHTAGGCRGVSIAPGAGSVTHVFPRLYNVLSMPLVAGYNWEHGAWSLCRAGAALLAAAGTMLGPGTSAETPSMMQMRCIAPAPFRCFTCHRTGSTAPTSLLSEQQQHIATDETCSQRTRELCPAFAMSRTHLLFLLFLPSIYFRAQGESSDVRGRFCPTHFGYIFFPALLRPQWRPESSRAPIEALEDASQAASLRLPPWAPSGILAGYWAAAGGGQQLVQDPAAAERERLVLEKCLWG